MNTLSKMQALDSSTEGITVKWQDLICLEKELVATLFNNSAFPVENEAAKKREAGGFALWSHCELHCKEADRVCDAYASVTKTGKLKLEGNTEFHGMGKTITIVLPTNFKVTIGANVEKTEYVNRSKPLHLTGSMKAFLTPCLDWLDGNAVNNERAAWSTKYRGKSVRVAYFPPSFGYGGWASVDMGNKSLSTQTSTPTLNEEAGIAIARSKFFDASKKYHARVFGPNYEAFHSADSLQEFLDQLLKLSWKSNITKEEIARCESYR